MPYTTTTYRLSYRTLLNGVTGIVLTGFRDGRAVTRQNLAAASSRAALIQIIAEVVVHMAVNGVEAEVA